MTYILGLNNPQSVTDVPEKSFPTHSFEAYEAVMHTIRQRNDDASRIAQKVLSWLFHAKRPLLMSELLEAIAIREGNVSLDEDYLMPADDDEIVEVCSTLVIHDGVSDVVEFSHNQVGEFLLLHYSDYLLHPSVIAKVCLKYLLYHSFEDEVCKGAINGLKNHPFAEYAASHWAAHVKGAAEDNIGIQQMLVELVQSPKKMDAMAQLGLNERMTEWDRLKMLHRGKKLMHVIAENNLIVLATAIVTNVFHVVTFLLRITLQVTNSWYVGRPRLI